MHRETLRIGLLVERGEPRPWQCRMAAEIGQDDRFAVCRVLALSGHQAVAVDEPSASRHSKLACGLLGLIEAVERRLFVPARISGRSTDCESLATPQRLDLSLDPSADAATVEALRELDLLISLAPLGEKTARELAAHTALWTIAASETSRMADPLFGFWDMFNQAGISRLALLQVSPSGSEIIAEGTFQTQFCFARNRCFLEEKSVSLVIRQLRRWGRADSVGIARPPHRSSPRPRRLGLATVASYLWRLAVNLAPRIYKKALRLTGRRVNRWSLFIGTGRFDSRQMARACEVRPAADEFWADPFLFRRPGDDQIEVFFENYEYTTGLGKISVGRLRGTEVEVLGDALVSERHLSYPFVFSHDGETYMIPETSQESRIEIWKAVDYPLSWVLHKAVMQGHSCADTTIFEHHGEWWMFTNISTDPYLDHCSALHIFRVDSPMLNEIEPHALNPVILDARTARNAGRIMQRDGRLTRLAQNNSYRYGYGFSLMEIERLSLEEYSEKRLDSAEPDFARGVTATHHMDQLDGVYVFDGQREFG